LIISLPGQIQDDYKWLMERPHALSGIHHDRCVDHEGLLPGLDPPCVCVRVFVDLFCFEGCRGRRILHAPILLPRHDISTMTLVNVPKTVHKWSRTADCSQEIAAAQVLTVNLVEDGIWRAVGHDDVNIRGWNGILGD